MRDYSKARARDSNAVILAKAGLRLSQPRLRPWNSSSFLASLEKRFLARGRAPAGSPLSRDDTFDVTRKRYPPQVSRKASRWRRRAAGSDRSARFRWRSDGLARDVELLRQIGLRHAALRAELAQEIFHRPRISLIPVVAPQQTASVGHAQVMASFGRPASSSNEYEVIRHAVVPAAIANVFEQLQLGCNSSIRR